MSRLSWSLPAVVFFLAALYVLALHHTSPPSRTLSSWKSYSLASTISASRLNLTLEGNEKRYQAAVKERKKAVARIGEASPACVSILKVTATASLIARQIPRAVLCILHAVGPIRRCVFVPVLGVSCRWAPLSHSSPSESLLMQSRYHGRRREVGVRP